MTSVTLVSCELVALNVIVPEFGEMVQKREDVAHDDGDGSGPVFHDIPHFDDKLMFRLQS